ncbi:ABC transporter permease [Pseudomaricurvus hydrocarbonicus]
MPMTSTSPLFELLTDQQDGAVLVLSGDWVQGQAHPGFDKLQHDLKKLGPKAMVVDGAALGAWDSILVAFLLQCFNLCRDQHISFHSRALPATAKSLLQIATAVPAQAPLSSVPQPWYATFNFHRPLRHLHKTVRESLEFTGELTIALWQVVTFRAHTRFSDFLGFCHQAGPDAFAIISLTSVLVGMILAYLGAEQLSQFGAEIYVADLVVIGTLREMGVLMTAVVMAGRTGASFAAQLGTMQTNEEIDAIVTMGISPVEFLVIPRILALVVMMPLLTLYANLLCIIGGGIVAGGMGIAPLLFFNEGKDAMTLAHLNVGLLKSVVFGLLIAVAGCRAGINCGRSSAAVGKATTEAVVTGIVYLIIADAAINILFQQAGI